MRPLVFFAAILLLLSSGQFFSCRRGLSPVQIDESAAGQTSHLGIGESLVLTLKENPSTGYRWRVDQGCDKVLETTHDEFTPGEARPGAPGSHSWTFLARGSGSCDLTVESVRPWETASTGKRLRFPVVVSPAS